MRYSYKHSGKSILQVLTLCLLSLTSVISCSSQPHFTHLKDVIYGRKFGTALTMDVLRPDNPNGCGIIWIVSGGWYSERGEDDSGVALFNSFLNRGYTCFGVVHGSQPRYTIPDIMGDLFRAVRYIRHHATEYGIRPDCLGIYGVSSGGHLALLTGVLQVPGDRKSKDPVEREPSKVQAVVAVSPPTDFLNYGNPGMSALGEGLLKAYGGAFSFEEYSMKTYGFVPVTNSKKRIELGQYISPVNHVTPDDPPTLIFHGDSDKIVPIQQSHAFCEKLKAAGVPHELVVKHNQGHDSKDFGEFLRDLEKTANWFDKHLRK